jgi:hypothetical protein
MPVRFKTVTVVPVQTVGSADPQKAFDILVHGHNNILMQSLLHRNPLEPDRILAEKGECPYNK